MLDFGVWGDFLLCLYLLFCVIGDVLCVVVCGCWFKVVGSRRDECINVCLAEFCALWRVVCFGCCYVLLCVSVVAISFLKRIFICWVR